MDIMMMGTVGGYARTWKLQTQWDLKKASGNVTGHTKSINDFFAKTPEAAAAQEQADQMNESDSKELNRVITKMYAGGKLTKKERALLKEKAPKEYEKLEEAERCQEAYEQELKRCRTKDDVQRLRARYANASLMRLKSIQNNPNISEEKKMAAVKLENMKNIRREKKTAEFIRSGEYAKLPTDAEKAMVEKEEREAKKTALKDADTEKNKETPDRLDGTGKAEQPGSIAEQPVQAEKKLKSNSGAKEAKDSAPEDGGVKIESKRARKVRRAKAKAAAYTGDWTTPEDTASPAISVKA